MEVRKFDKNYDTKEVSKEEETKRGEKERRGGLQIRIIWHGERSRKIKVKREEK